jgi:hypothetical protein
VSPLSTTINIVGPGSLLAPPPTHSTCLVKGPTLTIYKQILDAVWETVYYDRVTESVRGQEAAAYSIMYLLGQAGWGLLPTSVVDDGREPRSYMEEEE